jgi:hypothetical protein
MSGWCLSTVRMHAKLPTEAGLAIGLAVGLLLLGVNLAFLAVLAGAYQAGRESKESQYA